MEFAQIALMIAGLAVAGGGAALLFKGHGRNRAGTGHDEARDDVPRPGIYLPVTVMLAGAVIAYRALSHYQSGNAADVTIMFAFAFALIFLLGLRLLVVDRYRYGHKHAHEQGAQPTQPARPHREPTDDADDTDRAGQSPAPL